MGDNMKSFRLFEFLKSELVFIITIYCYHLYCTLGAIDPDEEYMINDEYEPEE